MSKSRKSKNRRTKVSIFENTAMYFDYDIDYTHKTLWFGNKFDPDDEATAGVFNITAEKVIKGLKLLESNYDHRPITIILNNTGGSVYDAFAIYDAIKNCKNKVNVEIYGQCMSAATLITQAAYKRSLSKHSIFMIHKGYNGHAYDHPDIVKAWAKHDEKDYKAMEDIYLERMLEKDSTLTRQKLKNLLLFDTILEAKEVIELGLADEII